LGIRSCFFSICTIAKYVCITKWKWWHPATKHGDILRQNNPKSGIDICRHTLGIIKLHWDTGKPCLFLEPWT
jgi:hypothetical protein